MAMPFFQLIGPAVNGEVKIHARDSNDELTAHYINQIM